MRFYAKYLVLSQRIGTDEGYEPFLEAAFQTEAEAQSFAADWNKQSNTQEFWVQTK